MKLGWNYNILSPCLNLIYLFICRPRWYVHGLTCVVQSSGDACYGSLSTKLGHTAVSFHSERVVEMRFQVGNDNSGFIQVCGSRLEADFLATGDTRAPVTVFTRHTVGEVTAPPGHQWWAPGQLQPAFCWQCSGAQIERGTRWSLWGSRRQRKVSLKLWH